MKNNKNKKCNKIITTKIEKRIDLNFEEFIIKLYSGYERFNFNEKKNFSGKLLYLYNSMKRNLKEIEYFDKKKMEMNNSSINISTDIEFYFPEKIK